MSGTDPLQQTFSYNESVLFYCSDGFHLQGPSIKYCRQSGDFKYNIPICTGRNFKRHYPFILLVYITNEYFLSLDKRKEICFRNIFIVINIKFDNKTNTETKGKKINCFSISYNMERFIRNEISYN